MAIEDDEKELERLLRTTAINQHEYGFLKGWLRRGASPAQLEAIKLIADWCKWCTTVEVAIIAAIGAFFKIEKGASLTDWVRIPGVVAVGCFVLSIVLAAAVFSSLPSAAQHIHPGQSVWTRTAYLFRFRMPMGLATLGQLALFLLGIGAFAVGVAAAAWPS
jgi:hypothetical protein